ncbi:MAG: hypothetical protein LBS26_06410 [Campylobacteraceae bacterium]|jgi:Sec-independent protein translocase protein TatA|nr:hypothetical protein [Campylobacteraceae bacterium]
MEWLLIVVLFVIIFFIAKKYDSEIKMLNKMVELNRSAIDENSKHIKSEQKKRGAKSKEVKPAKNKTVKTVKKSATKKRPAKTAAKA